MIKKIFLSLAVAIILIVPAFVLAADPFGVGGAAQGTTLIGGGTTVNASQTLPQLVGKIVGLALSFVGIIFFVLVLFAGLRWMTAFGNGEKVDQAKSIMEHAAIGLVIVLAAYAIATFVFAQISNLNQQDQPTSNANFANCSLIESGSDCVSEGCVWSASASPQCSPPDLSRSARCAPITSASDCANEGCLWSATASPNCT